jgi:hypothetical protein
MSAPIIDNVEPTEAPATEAAPAAPTPAATPAEVVAPKVVEAPAMVPTPAPVAANLFSSPAPSPAYTPTPVQAPAVSAPTLTPAYVSAPVAATLQKVPEPELMPAMKPYVMEDDDPYRPVYEDSSATFSDAPIGFPSALLANFSMDELSIDDAPKPV